MPLYPKPKKRFGQNFLTNQSYANQIIEALELNSDDSVVEIGPGRGVLTDILYLSDIKQVFAVEIDSDLAPQLKDKYDHKIKIIQQDILNFSFQTLYEQFDSKIKIVGNIPYNITSPIIFYLLENSQYIYSAVLMMQKEVASRLFADISTKDYGILSILVNLQAQVSKLFDVSRSNFFPQPKVDSSVVKIDFFKSQSEIENFDLIKQLVKTTFNNRRKMLRNTLKNMIGSEILNQIKSIPLNLRPENLSVSDFQNLAEEIKRFGNY